MLEKINELKRRTIDVLEKTKKEKTKYAEERKKIDTYFVESSKVNNLKEWEEFLIAFEKKCERRIKLNVIKKEKKITNR